VVVEVWKSFCFLSTLKKSVDVVKESD